MEGWKGGQFSSPLKPEWLLWSYTLLPPLAHSTPAEHILTYLYLPNIYLLTYACK